jgi:hypothetical protein
MFRMVTTALFLMCTAVPVWAAEAEPFNPDQPFDQALTTGLLRSLLNQAIDKLEDHVEISGRLNSDASKGDKDRRWRFKFYPEGKSKSDRHLTAEGWFQVSPEAGQRDWHFSLTLPADPSKMSPVPLDTPL